MGSSPPQEYGEGHCGKGFSKVKDPGAMTGDTQSRARLSAIKILIKGRRSQEVSSFTGLSGGLPCLWKPATERDAPDPASRRKGWGEHEGLSWVWVQAGL